MSLVSVALSIRHYGTNIPSERQDGLSQSVCGRKSFLFFRHRVSAVGNHFCFSVPECLRLKIIFVFSSQSVCGRKSFLFFRHRVSAARNHFCFFIAECLRLKIIFVFLSQSICGRKSLLFFYRRVSATENHFCFSVTECLRPEIIFVFSSQSAKQRMPIRSTDCITYFVLSSGCGQTRGLSLHTVVPPEWDSLSNRTRVIYIKLTRNLPYVSLLCNNLFWVTLVVLPPHNLFPGQ